MSKELKQRLGEINGRRVTLIVRANPGWNTPEDFSANLIIRSTSGEDSEEIVRIDNSHGKAKISKKSFRRRLPLSLRDLTSIDFIGEME